MKHLSTVFTPREEGPVRLARPPSDDFLVIHEGREELLVPSAVGGQRDPQLCEGAFRPKTEWACPHCGTASSASGHALFGFGLIAIGLLLGILNLIILSAGTYQPDLLAGLF